MKIGLLHEAYPFGGAEKVTSDVSHYLKNKGYEIFVFAYNIFDELIPQRDHDNITFIKINRNDLFSKETSNNILIRQVNQLGIDILIHVGGSWKINRKHIIKNTVSKHIYSLHGVPFWEIQDELQHLIRKSKTKKNLLSRLKYKFIKIPLFNKFGKKRIYNIYQDIVDSYDGLTILCDQYKDMISNHLRINKKFIMAVIPNAVQQLSIPISLNKKKQLLYVGRMSYADKRVDRLIDIWEKIQCDFKDWEFILVGDGAEKQYLENLVLEKNTPRVKFEGFIQNPSCYYQNASILCLSSSIESWGLVLTEAQQFGVVPIAFNCSAGVESILSPSGTNGILIPPFNTKLYEMELRKLMSDDILRHSIQKNVIKKSTEYNMDRVGELWEHLINKLTSK